MSRLLRSHFTFGLIVGILPLGSLSWLVAQEARTDQRLERAQFIETSEQDLAAAETIYREVITDPSATAETRTHARLLLGLCLIEQGKEEEGTSALRQAAEGAGVRAEEARSVLDGRAAARRRLEVSVTRLIKSVEEYGEGWSESLESLIAIGDPAVPFLLEALRGSDDHAFSVKLIDALLRIGSRKVIAFVDSVVSGGDVYFQRLVLERLARLRGLMGQGNDPRAELLGLVRALLPLVDSDEQNTRREIVHLAQELITTDELLELVTHRDRYVRDIALEELQDRGLLDRPKVMAAAGPIVASFIGSDDRNEGSILKAYLRSDDILATGEGKDLALAALRARVPVSVPPHGFIASLSKGHSLPASELAALCRDVGPSSGNLQGVLSWLVNGSLELWGEDSVADVLLLRRFGGDAISGELTGWLVRTATDHHYALIAAGLDGYGDDLDNFLYWMQEHDASPAVLPALERAVGNAELRGRLVETPPQPFEGPGDISVADDYAAGLKVVVGAMASIGTPEAAAALVRTSRLDPELLEPMVASWLLDGLPAFDRALLPFLEGVEDEDERRSTLMTLAWRGIYDRDAIRRAVAKGVGHRHYFEFILFDPGDDRSRYDQETVVRIIDGVISSDHEANWSYLYDALKKRLKNGGAAIPRPIVERLFARVLESNGAEHVREELVSDLLLKLDDTYLPLKRDLYRRVMGRDDRDGDGLFWAAITSPLAEVQDLPRLRRILRSSDQSLAEEALFHIGQHPGPEYTSWIVEALQHPDEGVRRFAMTTLYRRDGDGALEHILPLRLDANWEVRRDLCTLLARSTSPEAADVLVEALRDDSADVRKAAETSLSQLEQYYEHRRRWDHLKDVVSMDGGTAEEALVKLAKRAASKKGRIAAIRSLGTLAVPETLPFLIVLMDDKDPDIAKAAEEAVDRINTQPRRTKDE